MSMTTSLLLFTTNPWEVISHLSTSQSFSLVVVRPGNKLMEVGGRNQLEIATLHEWNVLGCELWNTNYIYLLKLFFFFSASFPSIN